MVRMHSVVLLARSHRVLTFDVESWPATYLPQVKSKRFPFWGVYFLFGDFPIAATPRSRRNSDGITVGNPKQIFCDSAEISPQGVPFLSLRNYLKYNETWTALQITLARTLAKKRQRHIWSASRQVRVGGTSLVQNLVPAMPFISRSEGCCIQPYFKLPSPRRRYHCVSIWGSKGS